MAVKLEDPEEDDNLRIEFEAYKILDSVDETGMRVKGGCVPYAYHYAERVSLGQKEVNALFMQLVGTPLDTYVKKNQFSVTEMYVAALDMVIPRYYSSTVSQKKTLLTHFY